MLPLSGIGKAFGGGGGGGGGTVVDALSRFENSTDGTLVTAAILSAGTIGASPPSWSMIGTIADFKVATAAEVRIDGLQISGGAGFGDAGGTRGLNSNCSTNHQYGYGLISAAPKVSIGYSFLCTGFTLGLFNFYNTGGTIEGASEFATPTFQTQNPLVIGVETFAGASATLVPIANDTQYWITILYDAAALLATLKVYTWPALTLVGTSTNPIANVNADHVAIGRYDAHAASENANVRYDDLAISYTGVYPLLPNS